MASRNDPEYEDLVQGALAGVLAAIDATDSDHEHPVQWLTAVARNVTIDRLRARTRERRVFCSDVDIDAGMTQPISTSVAEPEHLAHVRRQLQRLEGALQRLGPGRAMVVYLHDVLGYGLGEIAASMGISVAAAQSRLVRGRRALVGDLGGVATPRSSSVTRGKT